ncbi:MAG: DEAD/DEAH box helicase, partial [Methanobacteriota archaeon]
MLYCAPTSGGKSLVADVLTFSHLFGSLRGNVATLAMQRVLLVLPYRSLVDEKVEYYQRLMGHVADALGAGTVSASVRRSVVGLHGTRAVGSASLSRARLIVTTIERANTVFNRLIKDGCIAQLAAVVVDELHLLGCPQRGAALEILLSKLRFLTTTPPARPPAADALLRPVHHNAAPAGAPLTAPLRTQVIGMSATLPNIADIAAWLGARLYVSTFRPVPLTEFLVAGHTVARIATTQATAAAVLPALHGAGGASSAAAIPQEHASAAACVRTPPSATAPPLPAGGPATKAYKDSMAADELIRRRCPSARIDRILTCSTLMPSSRVLEQLVFEVAAVGLQTLVFVPTKAEAAA